jgi:hypothetical protein
MLLPVTGSSGGNRKSTVVSEIYARAIYSGQLGSNLEVLSWF